MATIEDRGMTGRDVIAKTFTAKARRGYEPVEVDSYLEQVGNQIDALRAEIARLEVDLADAQASASAASSLTPPPPVVEAAPPAPVVAEAPAPLPAQSAASVETSDIVLRMAHETSARAIEEAQGRADEILTDAEFKAAEMQRESDRKAFEAASRSQGELRAIQAEIEARSEKLGAVEADFSVQRDRLRTIADNILAIADVELEASSNGHTIDLAESAPVDVEADV